MEHDPARHDPARHDPARHEPPRDAAARDGPAPRDPASPGAAPHEALRPDARLHDAEAHDAFARWRDGGRLEGVHFAPGASVVVLEGERAGLTARVVSLQALAPEPLYVVAFPDGEDVGVLQSAVRPALPSEPG